MKKISEREIIIENLVIKIIQKYTKTKVTLKSKFYCELGIDSINLTIIINEIEKTFNITISGEEEQKMESVEDCYDLIKKLRGNNENKKKMYAML